MQNSTKKLTMHMCLSLEVDWTFYGSFYYDRFTFIVSISKYYFSNYNGMSKKWFLLIVSIVYYKYGTRLLVHTVLVIIRLSFLNIESSTGSMKYIQISNNRIYKYIGWNCNKNYRWSFTTLRTEYPLNCEQIPVI